MKHLNNKKTRFPRIDKILVIQPIAEVYGEANELQLYEEIKGLKQEVTLFLRYIYTCNNGRFTYAILPSRSLVANHPLEQTFFFFLQDFVNLKLT